MLFADLEYWIFLGVCLSLYLFVPARGRAGFLLLASYFFYLQRNAEHGLLLAISTVLDYSLALGMGRVKDQGRRKLLLLGSIFGNLGLLAAFKYRVVFSTLAGWLGFAPVGEVTGIESVILPLGISFYTFQTLGYSIDVFRKRIAPCRNFIDYALYVSFFPQLIAGPIERANHLIPQLQSLGGLTKENASAGGRLCLWGLLKKLVIADHMREPLMHSFRDPAAQDSLYLVMTAVGLAVYLYLDFSAYTDMARGTARIFGVTLVLNFNRPFTATGIGDFTRRWHMSLVSWIRDYVHWPLTRGGATGHVALWKANIVILTVFGVWHGAKWNYVVWCVAWGIMISIDGSLRLRALHKRRERGELGRRFRRRSRVRAVAGCLLTGILWSVLVLGLFAGSLTEALAFLSQVADLRPPSRETLQLLAWTLPGLVGLWLAHAAGSVFDLDRVWIRLNTLSRATLVLGSLVALAFLRVKEPLDFVYFRF
jgi:D-alanyl-lipoteichoic acid acyltransferase DltB (MBOAT superfamily)